MAALEPIIVVGGGALAREIAQLVHSINAYEPTFVLEGFLDDDPSAAGAGPGGLAHLGPLDAVRDLGGRRFVVALATPARPAIRLEIGERLALADDRLVTLVHPSCSIAASTAIGAGSVLLAGVVTTADVTIGRQAVVMPNCVFTHDDVVGDYTTFGAGALLAGRVRVGDCAYVGSGARIREALTVGRGAVVGMGSVVTRSIPDGETWAGVPARPLPSPPPAGVFVHPLGVCESSDVGAGTRVWAFAHVLAGAVVGRDCNICDHAYVEGGAQLGNNVTVKNGVLVFELVTIEDDVFLGPGMKFTNDLRPRAAIKKGHDQLDPTHVRRGATFGAGVVVVCGTTIGTYAMVAAGGVVTRDVPAHALMAGNPARRIGWVCECGERLDDTLECGCGLRYRLISEHDGLTRR